MKNSVQTMIQSFYNAYDPVEVKKNRIIIREGEEPQGVYFLEDGEVGQCDITASGATIIVNVFKGGAFFPMSWAINRTRNEYFFKTLSDTRLRIAPANEVVRFIRDNPEVMFDLLSRVFIGTEGLVRRAAHLMGSTARTRILFELSVTAKRHGNVAPSGIVIVNVTESNLALRSGLTRETVNRELRRLKESHLISVGHGEIRIHDFLKLENLVSN